MVVVDQVDIPRLLIEASEFVADRHTFCTEHLSC